MKRLLSSLPLLIVLSGWSAAAQKNKPFDVYDFSKGVDTYHSGTSLPDGFVQDSLNVCFDCTAPVSKRNGYTVVWSTKTYAYTGLWTYVDGSNNTWQIARSSDQITASNLTGTIVKVATVTASNIVGETNAFGNAYFVDQTQGIYYWNGSSATYIIGSPLGSIINTFHNRLWVSGAANPNINQLYGSKFGDGTTWTTGLNANDPVQYSVGLNDNFDDLNAMYVYLDTLYLFKHYSIFGLTGFDQTSFAIQQMTQECGCLDQNTIQTFNGGLKFVSARGVENFNGYTCQRISDPVKNKVDPATQNSFNTQSWSQQTTADWNAGTISPFANLSTSSYSPAIGIPTGSKSYTTTSDFNTGTFSATLATTGNQIAFVNSNGNMVNGGFDSGVFSPGWLSGTGNPQIVTTETGFCTVTPQAGAYMLQADRSVGATYQVSVISGANGSILSSISFSQTSCGGWTLRTIPIPSGYANKTAILRIDDLTDVTTPVISDLFFLSGNQIIFYTNADANKMFFDTFAGGYNASLSALINQAGSYNATFDTGFTSSKMLPLATWSTSDQPYSTPPTFIVQDSNDNATWTTVTRSTGSTINVRRYIQLISSFTYTYNAVSPQDAAQYLSNVQFTWAATSGTFTSACHGLGSITSFGNFSTIQDLTTGGNISYNVCTSASSNCSSPTCLVTSANSQITVSTNAYVDFIASFTVTSSTNAPKLDLATIQWYSGTKSPPMASTVWDNRYWLSLATTTSDTFNDAVLTFSSRGIWTIYDIHAGAFTQSKGNLYHADSVASGNVYLDNQGWADNGSPINAFVKSKELSFGNIASDDYLTAIYPTVDNLGNCAVNFSYSTDRSTATYALGSPNQSEFATQSSLRLPFPIDASHQNFGKTFNFTVGTNDAFCPLQYYGFRGYYKDRPVTK